MTNSDTKKKARRKVLASVLMLGVAASVFLTSTYSWIKRQWAPTVGGSNLRIEASGALAFRLTDSGAKDEIDLADQMGEDFVLSPVSNSSGESKDFFTLMRNTELQSDYYYKHISCVNSDEKAEDWQDTGVKYGYMEQSFKILYKDGEEGNADYIKFVYLDSVKTHLEDLDAAYDAADAIRISITVEQSREVTENGVTTTVPTTTYILGNSAKSSQAIINDTYTAKDSENLDVTLWKADGVTYYNPAAEGEELVARTRFTDPVTSEEITLTESVAVENITYYDGGITTVGDNHYVDPSKCLFQLSPSTPYKTVTVRVWLEGCDETCDDDIAGLQLDLCLSFAASNCKTVEDNGTISYQIIEQGQ